MRRIGRKLETVWVSKVLLWRIGFRCGGCSGGYGKGAQDIPWVLVFLSLSAWVLDMLLLAVRGGISDGFEGFRRLCYASSKVSWL